MKSTWLFPILNTSQTTDNGSTTEEVTYDEEDEGVSFDLTGKPYMATILIIASFGVVGNVMTFIITSDAKFSSFAYTVYLKWLAVSDSVLLVMYSTEDTLDTYGSLDVITSKYDAVYKLWNFFLSMTMNLSPWLVVALTLDRFVCVVFPLSRHVLCTRSKAIKLCAALTLVVAALNVHVLIYLSSKSESEIPVSYEQLVRYNIFLTTFIRSAVPCLLILVLNIITVTRIRRSKSFRKQFIQGKASNQRNQNTDKSTVPLVMVSVFAFVTLIPVTVTEVVETMLHLLETDNAALQLAGDVWPLLNAIYLLNFAQNFYILLATWPDYRAIIKQKLCRCETVKKSSGSRQTESSQTSSTQLSDVKVSTTQVSVTMTSRQSDLGSTNVQKVE